MIPNVNFFHETGKHPSWVLFYFSFKIKCLILKIMTKMTIKEK